MLSRILFLWYLGQTPKSFHAGPDHDRLHPLLRIDLLKLPFILLIQLLVLLVCIPVGRLPFLLQLRCSPRIIQWSLVSRFEHLFWQIRIEHFHILQLGFIFFYIAENGHLRMIDDGLVLLMYLLGCQRRSL